jgi:colanic acid biosynthesis glycosyl transferase WcaI
MARILLLTLLFSPDGVSTAELMTELALELKSLGHDLTVLAATPHYNLDVEARARQPLHRHWGGWLYRSRCGGIPVYHAYVPSKGSRVRERLKDYLRFHLISTAAGLLAVGKYDLILAPSPPLTIGLSAWLLGLLRRAPFIYNVQEIYPDIAVSLGVLQNKRLIGLMQWIEKFIYARACRVVVISEWFKRRLLEKGVPERKLVVIPNFVDTDFIAPLSGPNAFAASHGLSDTFNVLYAGNTGLTQDFETILAAARLLQGLPGLRFVIVGDGARRAWLEEQLAAGAYPNLLLLPYQPRSVVPQIYASSAVCLVPLKKGTAQETFPSKVYNIMSAARPVIASADPDSELAWLVQQAGCGFTTPPSHPAGLAAAVEQAYRSREALHQRGENGRRYVLAHHSRRAVAERYDELIRQVVKPKVNPLRTYF